MNKEKEKVSLSFLIIAIIATWIIITVIIWFVFKDWNKSGTFGDTFGAINSLFSGLALAGIIYTIYLQKTELSLQRKELQYTREELKRTADAQEFSSKMMTEQLRINNMPILKYKLFNLQNVHQKRKTEKSLSFSIVNNKENHAFDLDIRLFACIDSEEISVKSIVEERANTIYRKSEIPNDVKLHNNKFYFIYDQGDYSFLSSNTGIEIPLDYAREMKSLTVLVQYRDILGNNYYQCIEHKREIDGNYRSRYTPNTLQKLIESILELLTTMLSLKK